MAITTLDGIFAGLAAGPVPFLKVSQTAEGAGTLHSLWRAGGNPGAGATPPLFSAGSGYQCTSSTAGALPYTNPGGGNLGYLGRLAGQASTAGVIRIYDRLWTCSGLSANTASPQAITTPGALPARDRDGTTNGAGVEAFFEVYGAPGAGAGTWSIEYTDSAGNPTQTGTYAHPANAESVGQILPIGLADGDTGVRSVQGATLNASGTAGDIGITLARLIAEIPVNAANNGWVFDAAGTGLARLYDDSCLFAVVMCTTTNTGLVTGSYNWVHG